MLETELSGFADGLGVAGEGKRGDRKDSEICFARVTRKTESWIGKIVGAADLRIKVRSLVWGR